jgi:hypothetical protein
MGIQREIKIPKMTHPNHPMSIWVRQSTANFMWTVNYALELCNEHVRRPLKSGKPSTPHSWRPMLEWLSQYPLQLPSIELSDMPLCMDEDCKYEEGQQLDVVQAYRKWVNVKHNTWYLKVGQKQFSERRKIDWSRSPATKPMYIQSLPATVLICTFT